LTVDYPWSTVAGRPRASGVRIDGADLWADVSPGSLITSGLGAPGARRPSGGDGRRVGRVAVGDGVDLAAEAGEFGGVDIGPAMGPEG
jgi:hypothetical protein